MWLKKKEEEGRGQGRERNMKKVRDGLYIGDISDASALLSASNPHTITHLLSLISPQLMPAQTFGSASSTIIVRKMVPLFDTETENLLEHLDECVAFVQEGVKNGAILVHCLAGVSRSAAVVLAYIMKVEYLSLNDALLSLRQASDKVCPNPGFLNQLHLFQTMGYTIDKRNPAYKGFFLQMLGEDYLKGERMDWSRLAADPAPHLPSELENFRLNLVDSTQNRRMSVSRCKMCRQILASQENVLDHSPGVGQKAFKWGKRGGLSSRESSRGEMSAPQCSSIFVEPMRWMKTVQEGVIEGKLFCVKCEARLGSFNWAGLQCSCGAWVNPAFQLHKSRIDAA